METEEEEEEGAKEKEEKEDDKLEVEGAEEEEEEQEQRRKRRMEAGEISTTIVHWRSVDPLEVACRRKILHTASSNSQSPVCQRMSHCHSQLGEILFIYLFFEDGTVHTACTV